MLFLLSATPGIIVSLTACCLPDEIIRLPESFAPVVNSISIAEGLIIILPFIKTV